jgi:alkylation response protein AidB-like acyl-CoA dehydrogenase
VIERFRSDDVRRQIAEGRHLTTLAFSEAGSRSHFWAPMSSATADGQSQVVLDAKKSWVTSAGEADSYVWSSRPLAAVGASTLWLVPAGTAGVSVSGGFDGLGLRGNASRPMLAEGARVPTAARLGPDGGGFDVMMGVVLPHFQVLNATGGGRAQSRPRARPARTKAVVVPACSMAPSSAASSASANGSSRRIMSRS